MPRPGLAFQVRAGTALPGARGLGNALRPLKRRLPSGTAWVLDEAATAEQAASQGLWGPVLRPALTRWLDLALVIDQSPSMAVWERTVAELRRLLERHGSFRDVRTWQLDTDGDAAVLHPETVLHPQTGPAGQQHLAAAAQAVRDRLAGRLADWDDGDVATFAAMRPQTGARGRRSAPRELVDPTGRRLIAIVSDGVAPAWFSGSVPAMLAEWGMSGPVVLVNLLPQRLWRHTASETEPARLRALGPGTPNAKLQVLSERTRALRERAAILAAFDDAEAAAALSRELGRGPGAPSGAGQVAVPVVTLERQWLAPWAALVAGAGGREVPSAVLWAGPASGDSASAHVAEDDGTAGDGRDEVGQSPVSRSPAAQVREFQSLVSPAAFRLACYLSAVPVTLPIMRLVQQAMLPGSTQAHLAEVLLGGILERTTPAGLDIPADRVDYDFREGTRDLLLDALPGTDAMQVIRTVGDFIGSRAGRGETFPSLLVARLEALEATTEEEIFALVSARTLRRFGGEHALLADWIAETAAEQSIHPRLGRGRLADWIAETAADEAMHPRLERGRPADDEAYPESESYDSGTVPDETHSEFGIDEPEDEDEDEDDEEADNIYALTTANLDGAPVAISGSANGEVRVWGLSSGFTDSGSTVIEVHHGRVFALATAELDGRPVVISAGLDTSGIHINDLRSGRLLRSPFTVGPDDDNQVSAMAVGVRQGRWVVVTGYVDGTVQIWYLDTSQLVVRLEGAHSGPVSAVATAVRGSRYVFVTGSQDQTIRVWDLDTAEVVLGPLTARGHGVDALVTGWHNGRPVAISGSYDQTIRVWSLEDGALIRTIAEIGSAVYALAVAQRDGRDVIVCGADDGAIDVWDLESGMPVDARVMGHSGTVNAMAAATVNGSQIVVSGGADGTVRAWNLASHQERSRASTSQETGTGQDTVDWEDTGAWQEDAAPDLVAAVAEMIPLMLRNVASAGNVLSDLSRPARLSLPGCVIAAPHFVDSKQTTHNFRYNWTRDSAIVAMELANVRLPDDQPLADYVRFAAKCQESGADIGLASWHVDGTPREYANQSDGPALQTIAILELYDRLDRQTQDAARRIIGNNLSYLRNAYQGETLNVWEERTGASFFARSVHLRCFEEIESHGDVVPLPAWIPEAIEWLKDALEDHWNGRYYDSVLPVRRVRRRDAAYNPNIDIVMAAVYGAASPADTRILATAALLRSQWADPQSKGFFPINRADAERDAGPLLGRYPGDTYDAEISASGGHPWVIATANFAELYYQLARIILRDGEVPSDDLSSDFFRQIGVRRETAPPDAVTALQRAGDKMLRAVIYHSDHLELGEIFDRVTGYARGAKNYTWSYAAFLSAMRARTHLGDTLAYLGNPPSITELTPSRVRQEGQVILYGQNIMLQGDQPEDVSVTVAGEPAATEQDPPPTPTSLAFRVPPNATTGAVVVRTPSGLSTPATGGTSGNPTLTIIADSIQVSRIDSLSAPPGGSLTLHGGGFYNAADVDWQGNALSGRVPAASGLLTQLNPPAPQQPQTFDCPPANAVTQSDTQLTLSVPVSVPPGSYGLTLRRGALSCDPSMVIRISQ
jgi:glucoamylase